jgi:hypothetical protein
VDTYLYSSEVFIEMVSHKVKIIVEGATQVGGHSLKLHLCMFERSQVKHNSMDCHNFFGIIFN